MVMKMDTQTKEYFQRGGKVTRLPAGTAMNGFSAQMTGRALAPSKLAPTSYADGVKEFFDVAKSQQREKEFKEAGGTPNTKKRWGKSAEIGRVRGGQVQALKAAERRKRLAALYHSGVSVDIIAADNNLTVKHLRDLLRKEGIRANGGVLRRA